ncbi:MAG: hemerythrin family protein [bacterium]
MKFEWKDEYLLGFEEIDEQHQNFFKMADEVNEFVGEGNLTMDGLLEKLTALSNYALYHFETEENYFKKCEYPGAEHHIELHHNYKERMRQLIDDLRGSDDGLEELAGKVVNFAWDWFAGHILNEDRKYIENFKKCGVE